LSLQLKDAFQAAKEARDGLLLQLVQQQESEKAVTSVLNWSLSCNLVTNSVQLVHLESIPLKSQSKGQHALFLLTRPKYLVYGVPQDHLKTILSRAIRH